MLTLWTNPWSSNGNKVDLLVRELGADCHREIVSLARPRPDDYLALNLVGGIPAIRDGDLVLSESQAILRYLAAREQRADLYPADPARRAPIDEFLDRLAGGLRTQLFRYELVMLGWTLPKGFDPVDADPARGPVIAEEIQPALRTLDALVTPAGAVLGRFTIADCAIAPMLQRARDTGLDLSGHPNLDGLADALLSRPAWRALRDEGSGR